MPIVNSDVEKQYLRLHPAASNAVRLWTGLANRIDTANRIYFAYKDWRKTDRTTPPPDLVEWLSWYGYVDLRLNTWQLPIKLTDSEQEQWRHAGYYITVGDFLDGLATVASGIVYEAGKHPNRTIKIIQRQLDEKLAELNRLADLPLGHYTPQNQEWQIRKRFAEEHGLAGDELENEVQLALLEDDHDTEVEKFQTPFALRQQLESFEWAMECLRLIVMGEVNPKLGLPNQELFMALMQINLNSLKADLADVDKKLRRIWDHLAGYRCTCLNADYEPQKFWWRHYKLRTAGKPAR